uniref:Tub domain-containing protein n=1 Tax=Angiostrongylus cantonensis TaxID=6313 RepID=A0A0K0CXS4_ANGCA
MKIIWESGDWPGARIEPAVTHLAWVPQADRPGNGLLGVGSDSGSVGITITDLHPTDDDNSRYNFNLRGHHSAICMVTWNRVQTKLASCDSSGVIYVWVRNDDRWSVELVNDRGVKVRDLSWSPCGSSALICYEDNFVLIGSSTGQRVWSNSFPTAVTVTAGVWTPDSRQLVLGFASGSIQVLSDQGANITERSFTSDPIVKLAGSPTNAKDDRWILAILTSTNKILMISAFDQIDPLVYESPHSVIQMQWNSDGSILAAINSNHELLMLDRETRVIHKETLSLPREKSLSALTWAHEGQAIIVAAGGHLAIGRLLLDVPPLFDLVTYELWRYLGSQSKKVDSLPIPLKERNALKVLDHHIVRCRIPRVDDLCSFVCSASEARCYCTIKPLSRGSHSYVLCMEHLGGLVPLLVGRQVNRFLPQFHISLHPVDRQVFSTGSSAQVEDLSIIPRPSNGRNSLWRRSKRQLRALMSRHVRPPRPDLRLVQVSSNVWCTRFNITSMSPKHLPEFLGQVVYKTSVLHLQPRQMTIDMAMLGGIRDRFCIYLDVIFFPLMNALRLIFAISFQKRDRASINKMRAQMKELLRRVNEIEKKVGSGDVRSEVRQLVRTLEEMKCALGEGSVPKPSTATPIITMHNKTPFWNEHNQVYQVCRVVEFNYNTYVEMDGKQVLQFGRIEGGAYTLDFRRPFAATQAFAVALASITQRLK